MDLNYKSIGQGYPVVILHGLFGTLDNWQWVAKHLAQHHSVFSVDQRNHGRSPHLPDISYPILAEDLKEFMEHHWMYKANIIGHSMGGKTAMQFALDFPEMVNKLMVIDIAPKKYHGGHEIIFNALQSIDLQSTNQRSDVEDHLQKFIDDKGTIQFLLKNLTRNEDASFQWKMNLDALVNHYQDILDDVSGHYETFEGPSLFVKGSKSKYIVDADWQNIVKRFPQAELCTIADAGHWVHADQPQQLVDVLIDFMKDSH
ncbi:MAG: alpha/beta fold hydrolase [Saprospiraceae bacterium]|nr:alpha/beta fold hydrolase [Saprospiraceae bacterium]